MHPVIPTAVLGVPLSAYNTYELTKRKPGVTPSGTSLEQLADALDKRIDDIKPGQKIKGIKLNQNVPTDSFIKDLTSGSTAAYSNNSRSSIPGAYTVDINPNADRTYFAHELGHIASDQTDIGRLVRSARGNKALTRALAGAAILGGGTIAGLTPGDDDLASSVALAYAAAIPEIADEVLATKNGLAIMDTAGMRASLGQRGKLAAGLLSYLGAPLLIGAGSNLVGNQFDEDVVIAP